MDYCELERAITMSGFKKEHIAEKMGLSAKALSDRVSGNVEWKRTDIISFCKVLRLSKKDRDKIFFTDL